MRQEYRLAAQRLLFVVALGSAAGCGGVAPDGTAQITEASTSLTYSDYLVKPRRARYGLNQKVSYITSAAPVEVLDKFNYYAASESWGAGGCAGFHDCSYLIQYLPDPAPGKDKDWLLNFDCGTHNRRVYYVPKEAQVYPPKRVSFSCNQQPDYPSGTIQVTGAWFGQPCRTKLDETPVVANECNGFNSCEYYVTVAILSDPDVGCDKEFSASYRCTSDSPARPDRTALLSKEASGHILSLKCD
jgi:hypothetical protein